MLGFKLGYVPLGDAGTLLGLILSTHDGMTLGFIEGIKLGSLVGHTDGKGVGLRNGITLEPTVGRLDSSDNVGSEVGLHDGTVVGNIVPFWHRYGNDAIQTPLYSFPLPDMAIQFFAASLTG